MTTALNEDDDLAITENPLKRIERMEMYKMLDVLSPATRAICSLFYLEGFSVKEIAESLNLSKGTVKWHLTETRRKLKPAFENYYQG